MPRVIRLVAGVLLSGLLFLSGQAFAKTDCSENTGHKATGKPIPIGAVTSMTGIGSFKESDDAARAYFDCVNDNGSIHGRPIEYRDEDDQAKLDIAAQAAKKLVEDDNVYLMVGSASFVECIANANYYIKHNILVIGVGTAPPCFTSRNIASVNAGGRQTAIGAVDFARRKLGSKSAVCVIFKVPGTDYVCNGIEEWGKTIWHRSKKHLRRSGVA